MDEHLDIDSERSGVTAQRCWAANRPRGRSRFWRRASKYNSTHPERMVALVRGPDEQSNLNNIDVAGIDDHRATASMAIWRRSPDNSMECVDRPLLPRARADEDQQLDDPVGPRDDPVYGIDGMRNVGGRSLDQCPQHRGFNSSAARCRANVSCPASSSTTRRTALPRRPVSNSSRTKLIFNGEQCHRLRRTARRRARVPLPDAARRTRR